MQKGELKVFREIALHCNVVLDVGARTDIDYVLNSYGNGIAYFLFEPNPKFYKELVVKVGLLQLLGLSRLLKYFPDRVNELGFEAL